MKSLDGAQEVGSPADTCRHGQVGVVTVFLAWILIASLVPQILAAECAKAKRGEVSTTNYIKVNQQNWNDNSVVAAASMWNNAGGGYPIFWTNTSNNPPGNYAVLNVERVDGLSPTRDVCGTFSGLDVKVYTRTVTSSNEIVRCDGNGLAQNVAHEFGHRVGLDDAPAGAPSTSIMAQVNGQNHSVKACEASLADAINETEEERNESEKEDPCPGCPPSSPILLSLSRGRWELTNTQNGVDFDLNGDGIRTRTPWTAPGSDLAFLFSDRDGDGVATTGAELFGDARPVSDHTEGADTYTNGFEALVEWDTDRDGWVTPVDVNWNQLQLWIDRDHDGVCDGNEVLGLLDQGVVGISLEYKEIGKRDRHGNLFRYVGSSLRQKNRGLKTEKVYDVIFVAE